MPKCAVCGRDVREDKIKHVHIKDETKKVCTGCVTAIKGLA